MSRIVIPRLSDLHCPWADEWDAHAMIGRADAMADAMTRIDDVQAFGSGTRIIDVNGVSRHSSFGTRFPIVGGGMIGTSLGLSREALATTDDLVLDFSPAKGPHLGLVLRLPAHEEVGRPGLAETTALIDGLRGLGERLRADAQRGSTGDASQQTITDGLAALLAHGPSMAGSPFVRIATGLDGAGTTIEVAANGQGRTRRLDADAENALLRRIAPAGTMHLETHGGDRGRTYRSHGLRTTAPIPRSKPDAMTTMRLLRELGLADLPTCRRETS